jgi:hypothetical protein
MKNTSVMIDLLKIRNFLYTHGPTKMNYQPTFVLDELKASIVNIISYLACSQYWFTRTQAHSINHMYYAKRNT